MLEGLKVGPKRRRENPLKITVEFTPVADYDERIKRLWAILLRPPESGKKDTQDDKPS